MPTITVPNVSTNGNDSKSKKKRLFKGPWTWKEYTIVAGVIIYSVLAGIIVSQLFMYPTLIPFAAAGL